MTACTQNCDQGRTCTCGQITPILYKLIALDIWVFKIVTLGRAKRGETISAASYRADVEQHRTLGAIAHYLIDLFAMLLFGQRGHCQNAYLWQKGIYGD